MQEIWPLLQNSMVKHTGIRYKAYDPGWSKVFTRGTMDGRIKDVQLWETFPTPERRQPGMGFKAADLKPSFSKRYYRVYYGLSTLVAKEDWDSDQTGVLVKVIPTKAGELAQAHYTLMEQVCADWWRYIAFAAEGSNTPGMSDGRPLISNAHPASPNNTGTLMSNKLATPTDLSVLAYQQLATMLRKQRAPNNNQIINNGPSTLVIAPDLIYIGKQILQSQWEPNTADRNTNYIPNDGVKLTTWPYWNVQGSSGAASGTVNGYVLLADDSSLNVYVGDDIDVESQYQLGVRSTLFVSTCSFAVGADDWRGVAAGQPT